MTDGVRYRGVEAQRREELAALREDAGLSQEELGDLLGVSSRTISRYERGMSVPTKAETKRKYAHAVKVSVPRLNRLFNGDEGDNGDDDDDHGLAPKRFSLFVSLEQTARLVDWYESYAIAGLVQTEDYARALIETEHGMSTHAEQLVELRMSRQRALTRDEDPLTYRVVLYEACLRLEVGGRDVMRSQLQHLVDLAKLSNVTVHILPFSAGPHTSYHGGFGLLTLPWESGPSVVYLEDYNGVSYLESREDISMFSKRLDRILALCLTEQESREMVNQVSRRYL